MDPGRNFGTSSVLSNRSERPTSDSFSGRPPNQRSLMSVMKVDCLEVRLGRRQSGTADRKRRRGGIARWLPHRGQLLRGTGRRRPEMQHQLGPYVRFCANANLSNVVVFDKPIRWPGVVPKSIRSEVRAAVGVVKRWVEVEKYPCESRWVAFTHPSAQAPRSEPIPVRARIVPRLSATIRPTLSRWCGVFNGASFLATSFPGFSKWSGVDEV
jgi:hypothetical protein